MNINEDKYLNELIYILSSEDIKTVYQPIVSLRNGEILGYEALSRGPENSILKYPDELFDTARKYDKTWDLELLCRIKAIQRARNIPENKFLFINVDPHIFRDEKFKLGFTKEFIEKNNMSCENIIFEITEKTSIEDYSSFKKALCNYTDQGFKIAIDDTGVGYSGLKTITETKPHFVKIDMDIIRDIDKDRFKQALIEAFVKLSMATNMKLVAEGIETEEELSTLIDLGVYAGQGYLINKPNLKFEDISIKTKEKIIEYNRLKSNKCLDNEKDYIGYIARLDKAFDIETEWIDIKGIFDSNEITGICIVDKEFPVGIIMKDSLNSHLSKIYGSEVFTREFISMIMDNRPLIVDYYTPVREVSKAAMNRLNENIYDYIIVKKDNKYYGVVTIKMLLHHITSLN